MLEVKEYIAKRTFEESGNYAVDSFEVDVENSLNDRLGSDGVFFSNQITEQGNVPSENLLAVKVSPGKTMFVDVMLKKHPQQFLM